MEEQLFRTLTLSNLGILRAQIAATLIFDRSRKVQATEVNTMTLLGNYWATESADERNKIFATLGILPENNGLKSPEISYHVTTATLYFDVIEKMTFREVTPEGIGMDSETLRRSLRLDWHPSLQPTCLQRLALSPKLFSARSLLMNLDTVFDPLSTIASERTEMPLSSSLYVR